MKPLVIYHANCTDGFGAAFAAWLKLGDRAEYRPMNYTNDRALLEDAVTSATNREVYILDFSFPRAEMDAIFENAKRVEWLDHHKTAFEMYGLTNSHRAYALDVLNRTTSPHYVRLDNSKSGAMLAWEYFHPKTEVPMLIQHIDDRDRWQFKLDGSKEVHAALRSYEPWSFDQWWRLFYDKPGLGTYKRADLIQEGKAILRAHHQNVQAGLKQARACRLLKAIPKPGGEHWEALFPVDASGIAANAPSFLASDLGHELANKSGTFGLVWSMAGDSQVHCSLRSNGEYDVSAIAKAFGGGGHRNAAGFSTSIETLMGWLK